MRSAQLGIHELSEIARKTGVCARGHMCVYVTLCVYGCIFLGREFKALISCSKWAQKLHHMSRATKDPERAVR